QARFMPARKDRISLAYPAPASVPGIRRPTAGTESGPLLIPTDDCPPVADRSACSSYVHSRGDSAIMRNSGASVYVVDDDVSAREAMVGLACAAGFNVTGFVSATDFLAFRRQGSAGCLVLDVDLPDLNGLELQQRLSAAKDALPIIFVTGHGSVPMSVTAIKAGAGGCLHKPLPR